MLVAIIKNNERVYAFDYDIKRLKQLSDRNELRCPECGGILKVRIGKKITTYFCHLRNSSCSLKNNTGNQGEIKIKKDNPIDFMQSNKICPICNKPYKVGYIKSEGYIAKCDCAKEILITRPICPICKNKMYLRKNSKNNTLFWGCRNYPVCKGTHYFELK